MSPDVQQNIKTILSLLETTEEKYLASQTLGRPEVQDEEGLPLTEIHEELDAEGNVICKYNLPNTLPPSEVTLY